MRTAIVDWFSATVMASVFEDVPLEALSLFGSWFGGLTLAEDSRGPRNYFKYSRVFYVMVAMQPVEVGFVAWGGDGQRDKANLVLNGKGCSLVQDWARVRDWCNANDAVLCRVDTAVDFMDGEFTVDEALQRYGAGDFNYNNQPSHRCIGPWFGDDNKEGRTFEVGKRKNGKMCRVYEKGKEQKNTESDWVRVEVEHHNRDRIIPYEILTQATEHFAGAYPFFNELVNRPGIRIATLQAEFDVTVEAYTENLRRCFGKVITAIRESFKNDSDMVTALSVAGVPKRLHKASLKLIRNESMREEAREEAERQRLEAFHDARNREWIFGEDKKYYRTAM